MRRAALLAAAALAAACFEAQRAQVPDAVVYSEATEVAEGRVIAVDDAAIRLLVRDEGSSRELALDEATSVVRDGAHLRRQELRAGAEVRVFYRAGARVPEALRIEILADPPAEPPARGDGGSRGG